jgi:hypothetical protein
MISEIYNQKNLRPQIQSGTKFESEAPAIAIDGAGIEREITRPIGAFDDYKAERLSRDLNITHVSRLVRFWNERHRQLSHLDSAVRLDKLNKEFSTQWREYSESLAEHNLCSHCFQAIKLQSAECLLVKANISAPYYKRTPKQLESAIASARDAMQKQLDAQGPKLVFRFPIIPEYVNPYGLKRSGKARTSKVIESENGAFEFETANVKFDSTLRREPIEVKRKPIVQFADIKPCFVIERRADDSLSFFLVDGSGVGKRVKRNKVNGKLSGEFWLDLNGNELPNYFPPSTFRTVTRCSCK